ncbi:glycine/betaine ABC transporter [Pseudomonas sp. 10-1B]|uniref:glycine betaine ABC transporter substrate-binding protein n=1 Tax=Pseudomonas sp. 10-1B TaxID=1546029 RepID=UPI00061FD9E2|nr:glycine betaine ABC transporter substrate-binding protein [Pseudomonas sp. 10-1B]KIY40660.1 glycine/betaine ABC transporter [Pseudomonas sp. 10-1B]
MRVVYRLFAMIVLACLAAVSQAEEKTSLKVGTMSWEDLTPITAIGKRFLESEKYSVEVTKFSEWGIAYSALARGDVDILVSQINYVASDYWQKNKQRLEKVSVVSHGLRQGIVVPTSMPINSIEELNSVKDQVGEKIIGIEPGSGLMRELNTAVKDYGLQYKVIDGSTAAMAAQVQSSLERKQPIVAVLWTPSWMSMKYDMKFLDDPKHVFAPSQTYYWIAKKGFSAENPHLREVLASMYVPIETINAINGAVKDGATEEQAIDQWWKDNSDITGRWAQMSSK